MWREARIFKVNTGGGYVITHEYIDAMEMRHRNLVKTLDGAVSITLTCPQSLYHPLCYSDKHWWLPPTT